MPPKLASDCTPLRIFKMGDAHEEFMFKINYDYHGNKGTSPMLMKQDNTLKFSSRFMLIPYTLFSTVIITTVSPPTFAASFI